MTLANNPTLTVNNAAATLTVGGPITGAGQSLTKVGSGALAISSTGSSLGTLNVNGGNAIAE